MYPADQQRPAPEAVISLLGLFQFFFADGKPAFVSVVFDKTAQQPVQCLAQYIARGRHGQPCPGGIGVGQQQADQHRFRLHGQQRAGTEGGEEQAEIAG
uniref:Uncharacterized protein n=1 Tax=Pseudomonas putida TaxID=303 RepID=Q8VMI0_PSEPU|nr:hypothetical protein [Pseudomonas putida]